MAKAGDAEGFWKSRQQNGDPIAGIALGTLGTLGSPSTAWYNRLEGMGANGFLEGSSLLNQGQMTDLDAVHKDLMQAHVDATLANGNGNTPLTPEQVANYHHDVFDKYGLPHGTFGGTPFTGNPSMTDWTGWAWYHQCK